MPRRRLLPWAAAALLVPSAFAAAAVAATPPPGTPVVLHSGLVTRQDIASQDGSEPDTVVEPDVEVNPTDSANAIAVAHDSRFADGGAVDISAAWTTDGGASWRHRPVPGITKAAGGGYDRASDPVVAFAADGTAYLSVLVFDATDCRSGIAVLTSGNGGASWSAPHYAHQQAACTESDDKNWITVDNNTGSPHFGRVYQFWTPYFYENGQTYTGSPQVVRWSDDEGATWSATAFINGRHHGSQDSQPVILADGTLIDVYYDFGVGGKAPDAAPGSSPAAAADVTPKIVNASGSLYSSVSTNGGRTWQPQVEVVNNAGGYSPGVRCCLMSATLDERTQTVLVSYEGGIGNTDPVFLVRSRDGQLWSSPVQVTRGDTAGVTRVNSDVSARNGNVYVTYGTRTDPSDNGGYVQQQLSVSTDRGLTFGAPQSVGPRSVLQYAARAGGYFPGDYIGSAVAPGRLYLVWAVSSAPPAPSTSQYHQVIWGATLRP